jgi:hypothetical protein
MGLLKEVEDGEMEGLGRGAGEGSWKDVSSVEEGWCCGNG